MPAFRSGEAFAFPNGTADASYSLVTVGGVSLQASDRIAAARPEHTSHGVCARGDD
jgi:hypothetical protein